METVTLENGRKAVQLKLSFLSRYGDRHAETLYASKIGGTIFVAPKETLVLKNARSRNYWSNVTIGPKALADVLTKGGTKKVRSGYGEGTMRRDGSYDSTLTVEMKGSRVKITAPCGAVLVMTKARVEKLVEAVMAL